MGRYSDESDYESSYGDEWDHTGETSDENDEAEADNSECRAQKEMEEETEDDSAGDNLPCYEDFCEGLKSALSFVVHNEGTFALSSTKFEAPNPGLTIEGLGIIGLPLSEREAKTIITKCRQSPLDKGEKTLVDQSVRKSWELDSRQFSIRNVAWQGFINNLLNQVHEELSLPGQRNNIRAQMYKLLLYEEGAFFKAHQDFEKTPGMFGTMVVSLPSKHEGGSVILTHSGKRVQYDSSTTSEFGTSCAAWYADVLHEVAPVTSGYRLVLTYNLVQKGSTAVPKGPLSDWTNVIAGHLEQYEKAAMGYEKGYPPYIIHKLEHPYTEDGLKLGSLKGSDSRQVQCLRDVCQELDFEVYLASVEKALHKDDDCGDEVFNRSYFLDPPDTDDEDHEESEHEGWTGNEGAPATYWYRSSAVVLVPPSKKLDFALASSDSISAALSLFDDIEGRAKTGKPLDIAGLYESCTKALPFLNLKSRPSTTYSYMYPNRNTLSAQEDANVSALAKRITTALLEYSWIDPYNRLPPTTKMDKKSLQGLAHNLAQHGVQRWNATLRQIFKSGETVTARYKMIMNLVTAFDAVCENQEYQRDLGKLLVSVLDILFDSLPQNRISKQDATTLAVVIKHSWPMQIDFTNKHMSQIARAAFPFLTAFIFELFKKKEVSATALPEDLVNGVISTMWSKFTYNEATDSLSIDDLTRILDATKNNGGVTMVDTLHNMRAAAIDEKPEYIQSALLPFITSAMRNKVHALILEDDQALYDALSSYITTVLCTYVRKYVGVEPNRNLNWSRPQKGCGNCADCQHVAQFMANPHQKKLHFPAVEERRKHLSRHFEEYTSYAYSPFSRSSNQRDQKLGYTINTITGRSPYTWHCVKNHNVERKLIREWEHRHVEAQNHLKKLAGPRNEVLGRFLGEEDVNAIMSCRVERLPAIDADLQRTPLKPTGANVQNAFGSGIGRKRPLDGGEGGENDAVKRMKTGIKTEIIDLTDD